MGRKPSGSADKTLKLWDLAAGECLQTLSGHTNWVLAACLSEDNQYALSAGGDGRLRLWDLATGSCLRDFGEHGGPVLCLAWSPDRLYALSGGREQNPPLVGYCFRPMFADIYGTCRQNPYGSAQ